MNDFRLMNENAQAYITRNCGVYLASRMEPEHRLILFRIEDFYVEISYHVQTKQIDQICSFTSDDQLEPYLAALDLTDLFACNN